MTVYSLAQLQDWAKIIDECGRNRPCTACAGYVGLAMEGLRALNNPRRQRPASDQACKQDVGKVRWSLLFGHCQEALKEVVAVRAYGESKYGTSESWREVAPERYLEAATRHVLALHAGHEINTEDGGMRHAAQAITDLLFYLTIELREERS